MKFRNLSQVPTAKYKQVEIVYNLDLQRWVYTLWGKERQSSTLELAMDAIDKPEPSKAKKFDQFKAYFQASTYDNDYRIVTVTSLACDSPSYRDHEAWIRHEAKGDWKKKGDREKVMVSRLFAINEHNDKVIKALQLIDAQQAELSKQEHDKRDQMQPTHIKKSDYDDA